MTDKERYFWDLTGFVVLHGVLSEREVAAANQAIDDYAEQLLAQGVGAEVQGKEQVFNGQLVRTTNAYPFFLQVPESLSDPFRRMLVHPRILETLNEMCGKCFRLDHGP